jgi:probable F420-dependent oxidoreductase
MQIGVIFPHNQIESDAGAIRSYVEAVSDLGFRHLSAYDHVIGGDPNILGELGGPYTVDHTFHEPMTLLSWIAGFTKLTLATEILIAPQRQTVLIAKQAAQIDILSGGGKFRLGMGVGWNKVEYDALGMPFANRGRRLEEQIALLRALWTQRVVEFTGSSDSVHGAGIAPLPPTQPIPIWLGATLPPALERIGRVADGWFPRPLPGPKLDAALQHIAKGAQSAGRDPSTIGMESQVRIEGDFGAAAELIEQWRLVGATHVSLDTIYEGRKGADTHIKLLTKAANELGLA